MKWVYKKILKKIFVPPPLYTAVTSNILSRDRERLHHQAWQPTLNWSDDGWQSRCQAVLDLSARPPRRTWVPTRRLGALPSETMRQVETDSWVFAIGYSFMFFEVRKNQLKNQVVCVVGTSISYGVPIYRKGNFEFRLWLSAWLRQPPRRMLPARNPSLSRR